MKKNILTLLGFLSFLIYSPFGSAQEVQDNEEIQTTVDKLESYLNTQLVALDSIKDQLVKVGELQKKHNLAEEPVYVVVGFGAALTFYGSVDLLHKTILKDRGGETVAKAKTSRTKVEGGKIIVGFHYLKDLIKEPRPLLSSLNKVLSLPIVMITASGSLVSLYYDYSAELKDSNIRLQSSLLTLHKLLDNLDENGSFKKLSKSSIDSPVYLFQFDQAIEALNEYKMSIKDELDLLYNLKNNKDEEYVLKTLGEIYYRWK